jgi:hypothetical protein
MPHRSNALIRLVSAEEVNDFVWNSNLTHFPLTSRASCPLSCAQCSLPLSPCRQVHGVSFLSSKQMANRPQASLLAQENERALKSVLQATDGAAARS